MRQNCPNVSHPSDEYLTEGANLYSSGQNPSAIGGSSIQPDTSRDLKLEKIERTLDEHTRRNTALELQAWQVYLDQREKDRQNRVAKLKVKPYQYHAGDLFDIETHILDLAEHVRHLVLNLVPLVSQPLLNSTDFELQVDKS